MSEEGNAFGGNRAGTQSRERCASEEAVARLGGAVRAASGGAAGCGGGAGLAKEV